MTLEQLKTYTVGVLRGWFPNKKVIDKLGEKDENLTYNDKLIGFPSITYENAGLAPVGTIIAYMGNIVPTGYLKCDGTEYNISEYEELALHILSNFGSYKHFGGDGINTFAVPDLRGEFLRGTGTATRDTGTGAEIGEHQDGTSFHHLWAGSDGNIFSKYTTTTSTIEGKNYDKVLMESTNYSAVGKTGLYTTPSSPTLATSRPTNTSILWCIKAKEDNPFDYDFQYELPISKEEDNALTEKDDGLYVPKQTNTDITDELSESDDGQLMYKGKKIAGQSSVSVNGSDNSPIGSILIHMSAEPPDGYLLCDGSIYNILVYPQLSEFIKKEYGEYNYFGGDNTETFAVPLFENKFMGESIHNIYPYIYIKAGIKTMDNTYHSFTDRDGELFIVLDDENEDGEEFGVLRP